MTVPTRSGFYMDGCDQTHVDLISGMPRTPMIHVAAFM